MKKYEALLVSLRKVIRAIDLHSKQLNKETGLTSPQLIVLQHISVNSGEMVKDIAKNINLSSATVTSILDRLEARNYVIRERSTVDKRKVGLYLTEAGHNVVKDSPTPLQQHFIRRFEKMEEWEQSQMLAIMERLAKMMDAEDIDASPFLQVGGIHPNETVSSDN